MLRGLTTPGYGWRHHPAVGMWRGHPEALGSYGVTVCRTWFARGFADSCELQIREELDRIGVAAPPQQELADAGAAHPGSATPACTAATSPACSARTRASTGSCSPTCPTTCRTCGRSARRGAGLAVGLVGSGRTGRSGRGSGVAGWPSRAEQAQPGAAGAPAGHRAADPDRGAAPPRTGAAFPVTLAVIALLGTLIAAANRVQEGWARDDVRRFTADLRAQTDQLPSVIGTGTKDLPGFPSAQELATGKLKGNQLAVRASGWSAKLGQIQAGRVDHRGRAPADAGTDGEPANAVGGRVPMLTSVRDDYAAAIEMYFEAANTFQKAGEASGKTATSLVEEGTAIATTAGKSMDAAAGALARSTPATAST